MAVAETEVAELHQALAAGATIIDVREPHEVARGHIEGAVHIQLATVPDHVDAFRDTSPTYVICHVGARSMRACEFLEQQGIEAINVAGGMVAWVTAGYPVVQGPATGSL